MLQHSRGLLFLIASSAFLLNCGPSRPFNAAGAMEAHQKSQEYWSKALTQCGESFYGTDLTSDRIIEMRGFIATAVEDSKWIPTEADKLNGLEWVGLGTAICNAFRTYQGSQWSEWHDSTWFTTVDYPGLIGFPVRKVKGEWRFDVPKKATFVGIPCDKIPR